MSCVLIVGIGNPLQGPDAFGPAVIERLRTQSALPSGADLLDAGTDLLSCLDRFADVDHVVLVDAFLGAGTGAIVTIDEPTFSTWSLDSPGSHELSAVLVVRLFRLLHPASHVRFTLVGFDVDRLDSERLVESAVAAGADAVLHACA
jgi:hydrogenase maturation protease